MLQFLWPIAFIAQFAYADCEPPDTEAFLRCNKSECKFEAIVQLGQEEDPSCSVYPTGFDGLSSRLFVSPVENINPQKIGNYVVMLPAVCLPVVGAISDGIGKDRPEFREACRKRIKIVPASETFESWHSGWRRKIWLARHESALILFLIVLALEALEFAVEKFRLSVTNVSWALKVSAVGLALSSSLNIVSPMTLLIAALFLLKALRLRSCAKLEL